MTRLAQVTAGISLLLISILSSAQTTTTSHRAALRDIRRYVIVNGDTLSGSWDSEESPNAQELRSRYGEHFAWFREGGREYVITDPGVMAKLDKAMEPQKKVNLIQADVNREQSRVNDLQATVNAHQKDVSAVQHEVSRRQDIANRLQWAVSKGSDAVAIERIENELHELRAKPDVNQASVNQMQAQVNEEQHGVNDEQAKVNEMQHSVNDEQHRVSAEFDARMREIFSKALENGAARATK